MNFFNAMSGMAALLATSLLCNAALASHNGGLPHGLGGLNPSGQKSISATAPAQPSGGGRPRLQAPQSPGVISGTAPSRGGSQRMQCRFC
jgi:hypothetical protein